MVLVVVGAIWLFGGFDREQTPVAEADTCVWNPLDASANDNLTEVGTPPTNDVPTSGTAEMMVSTNQGEVHADLDVASAPCATTSLKFLADQGFYGNTECHQLLTGENGVYALRCGDPSGTGTGGPTYTFASENLPESGADATPGTATPETATPGTATASPPASSNPSASTPASPSASTPADRPLYPKGTVALANDVPGGNGSQFFIFYQDSRPDSAQYPIVGTVTRGLDVIEKVAKGGTVDDDSGTASKPKLSVKIQNLTVTGPTTPSAPATGSSATTESTPTSSSPSASN